MKPAEKPDEKDDREWYADQPEQKTSTHSLFPPIRLQANVASGFKFLSAPAICLQIDRTLVYGADDCTLSDQRRRRARWTRLVPAWEQTKEQS